MTTRYFESKISYKYLNLHLLYLVSNILLNHINPFWSVWFVYSSRLESPVLIVYLMF